MSSLSLFALLMAFSVLPVTAANTKPDATATGKAAASQAAHGGHQAPSGRGPKVTKVIALGDTTDAAVALWQPDLQTRMLTPVNGKVTLPRTDTGDYHALVATWSRPQGKEFLVRYEYLRGRPSGRSPRELIAAEKADLEILPDPIPREHYRYHADESWSFLVRFRGEVVAGADVVLATDYGSRLQGRTDASGRVSFRLPDDFPAVSPGRRANPPAGMTLRVEHEAGAQRYVSRLNADYHADPGHWQSVFWGTGVAALGLIAGLAVTRRGSIVRNGK